MSWDKQLKPLLETGYLLTVLKDTMMSFLDGLAILFLFYHRGQDPGQPQTGSWKTFDLNTLKSEVGVGGIPASRVRVSVISNSV